MKNLILLALVFMASFTLTAQTITFEDGTDNGATPLLGAGTVEAIYNPYQNAGNMSDWCLHVVNNDYLAIAFPSFILQSGDKASYPYVKLRFKLCYMSPNGESTDINYPQVDIYSSVDPVSGLIAESEKLGTIGNPWGTAQEGVWVNAEFMFSASALQTIPDGQLVIKLAKPTLEYLIDDIEVVPSPLFAPDIISLFDFEADQVDKTYSITAESETDPLPAAVKDNPNSAVPNTSSHVLQMPSNAYGQMTDFTVTLPDGTTLGQYDRIYFDFYTTSTLYAQWTVQVAVGDDSYIIYKDASGYPTQASGAWTTKDYALTEMPDVNSFTLNIGLTSYNSGPYFLDNFKLHLASASGINTATVTPLTTYCIGKTLHLGQTVDKVVIFNVAGQQLSVSTCTESVNLSNLPQGIYIVKASLNGQSYNAKFNLQ